MYMEKSNRNGIVRLHRSKLTAIIRLFDIAIIGMTLKYLLQVYGFEFHFFELLLLLIAFLSFGFFAELNLLPD